VTDIALPASGDPDQAVPSRVDQSIGGPERPRPEPRAGRTRGPVVAGAARRAGKQVARSFGTATASHRLPPDFLIVGTKRGGTTSLYFYLEQHPHVLPLFPSGARIPGVGNQKGVHYFDTGFQHDWSWYLSHFPSRRARHAVERRRGGPVSVGEGSPYYLFHPLAAGRAYEALPQTKIIVILRDPVARTYSHYREQRNEGVELLSFEEALAAEPERLAGEEERLLRDPRYYSFAHERQSYVSQSFYVDPLRRWWDLYPREQVLVLLSEDLFRDTQSVYNRVLDFLGLPSHTLEVPKVWNPGWGTSMSTTTKARLAEGFSAHNETLGRLLDIELPWS
jgi:hypothetical protein